MITALLVVTLSATAAANGLEEGIRHGVSSPRRGMTMIRRGRPPKFGRPARSVAVTLPKDVIDILSVIDADLARAIVALVDQNGRSADDPLPIVDLVPVTPHHKLIVVDQRCFRDVPRCSLVPLSGGRAFLALEPGCGIGELELAIVDRLEEGVSDDKEKRALQTLRRALGKWRRDRSMSIKSRSIVLIEHAANGHRARPTGS